MLRQTNKFLLTNLKLTVFLWVFFFSTSLTNANQLQNAVVVDPISGIAIGGYDPVSYFTKEEPELGFPEYEYIWFGVSWIFTSEANRDIFALNPQTYAPIFGGHGTMSLSRGYLSDGNPHIFKILGGRLFLFYSSANKDAFMLAQKTSYIKAQKNWDFFTAQE